VVSKLPPASRFYQRVLDSGGFPPPRAFPRGVKGGGVVGWFFSLDFLAAPPNAGKIIFLNENHKNTVQNRKTSAKIMFFARKNTKSQNFS